MLFRSSIQRSAELQLRQNNGVRGATIAASRSFVLPPVATAHRR